MNGFELAISHSLEAAILVALAGALVRRRSSCAFFLVYLATVLATTALMSLWPDTFFNREFWSASQSAYVILKLMVALELAWRSVRAFPGAAATARAATLALLVASTLVILNGSGGLGDAQVAEWLSRINSVTSWLFTLTALIVLWYRLPIQHWHRAILMGFTPYVLVWTTLLRLLPSRDFAFVNLLNALDGVAYLTLVSWWAYAAWRRDELTDIAPEVARALNLEDAAQARLEPAAAPPPSRA